MSTITLKKKSDLNISSDVDLKSKTIQQLWELIERQNKLLKNRSFLEKLPDKGKKIMLFYNKLISEKKLREIEINSTCQSFSNLTLCGLFVPDELEWNEKNTKNRIYNDDENYYCNTDEKLCFELMSNHSGTAVGFKEKSDKKEKNYITRFCKKYDLNNTSKDRFKLNQLKDCSQDLFLVSAKKVKEKLGNKWEVTEATPPIFSLKSTKSITLCESLKLEKKHFDKKKDLENNIITSARPKQNNNIEIANSLQFPSLENHYIIINGVDDDDDDDNDNDGKWSDYFSNSDKE